MGFNHFFRGHDADGGGDQIYFQGHASPGIYARAFVEGRLSESQLDGFRQEISHAGQGGGLPSYPHPRLMPDFWEFTTVSMGLGPISAIYQARFNRYLHHRGIKDTSGQHVWAFVGDGEMDEPEALGALGVAAREGLDNLTFVVNCNLQRLDGPVRGNGKIIQELESYFRGAGWNVIKVVWGREWDPLLEADRDGALVDLLDSTPDGDFQTYKSESGAFVREHFFGRDPRTRGLVETHDRRRDLGPQTRRTRQPQGVCRVRRGPPAPGPADRHLGADHQGMDARVPLREPKLHPPDEEAHPRGPEGVPGPPPDPARRQRAGRGPSSVRQTAHPGRSNSSTCTSVAASSAATSRTEPSRPPPCGCPARMPTQSPREAPGTSRWRPRWASSAC